MNRLHDPLDATAITRALGARGDLEVRVVDACASTNALLLEEPAGPGAVLLAAELQTAGRGRRRRRWISPRGAGLTFSLRRLLACGLRQSAGLPLAAGVAIARALVTDPTLLVADEPTGELDTVTTRQILGLFKHVIAREGVTILTTTHDPIVDEYADVIYTLQDGQLHQSK